MKPDEPRPEDPKRREMQPDIPARPPGPVKPGDAEKVVGGPPLSGRDPNQPAVSSGISSGEPIDHTGGAGLGKPPGEGDAGASPTTTRDQQTRADDPQDRRDKT